MHVFRPRTDLGRCLIAFSPLLCALMVAMSRLADYRHDVYDVTCGGLLGMLIAWFSYRRYYPPLRSVICDVPYDKADLAGPDGFARLDDEEALARPFIPGAGPSEESYQLQDIVPSRST